MKISDLFLTLLVVAIWGCNFIFIKFGLKEMSPVLLCAVRFFLASVPAIFFFRFPKAPFKMIVAYGLVMFAMQFSLVFLSMHLGMTPGMASLLTQVQIFFSMIFALMFLKEVPRVWQILGAMVSFAGIGLVAGHLDTNMTLASFIAIMGAAASYGFGNLITKKIGKVNMMSLVVWGSFIACIPLTLVSFMLESPKAIILHLEQVSWLGIFSISYIVYASTWIGYGVWSGLLHRYTMATLVPFSLLVPVFGILSSVIVFHEPFQSWKLVACLLVITGLFINIVGARLFDRKLALENNS